MTKTAKPQLVLSRQGLASALGDHLGIVSMLGLWADLGPTPSAKEIDEIRREIWADFPREDI